MTPRTRRTFAPLASPIPRPAARLAAGLVAVAMMVVASGCTASSASREARSAGPSTTRDSGTDTDPESRTKGLTFDAGAELNADADISWGDGLIGDAGWEPVPSDHPGRWSYVNAAGTCTASFRGGVLGDAGEMDDREATDALIEYQSGDDFLGPEMLTDGEFAAYEGDGSGIAHRQFGYTVNELGYFMAARAFVQADYSVSVIVTCEGEPVGPVAQEVLSKNVIAVDAQEE